MVTLVTGANGFIGSALCETLVKDGISVRRALKVRGAQCIHIDDIVVGDICSGLDWGLALRNVDRVVHLAGRVHVMNEKSSDPLTEFRLANVEATASFARQAAAAGVKRFVFLSSIKVNGDHTDLDLPFTAGDACAPEDHYGISKLEAEELLRLIALENGMEVVIIRPPLVYGPGVKANFLSMMNWLYRGIPLPLSGITKNRRSLIFIDNLVSLIVACLEHPAAANQTFLVSDDEDLSTAGLLERMDLALGRPSILISMPTALITLGAKLIGRSDISQRLCGSLHVDIKKTKDLLGWSPPVSVDEGLRQTAIDFLKMQS